jgi:hypothetical protein
MKMTLWTYLDTNLLKPTSLSPANLDPVQIEEWVYDKGPIPSSLQPPILIPTAVKLQEYKPWVHISSIK